MSDQFQPDYPQWVRQIFEPGFPCTRCGRRLKVADLVGLGVSRPQAGNTFAKSPRGRAFADCSKCFKPFCFEVEAAQADIVEAVNEFYEHIEMFGGADDDDDDIGKPFVPSPNPGTPGSYPTFNPSIGLWSVEDAIQGADDDDDEDDAPPPKSGVPDAEKIEPLDPAAGLPFDIVPPEKTPAEKRWESIRRRKKAALKHPPTDAEVKKFLKQLNRTSFKRSSKGFRHFMGQLGIDIDWPGPSSGGGRSDGE